MFFILNTSDRDGKVINEFGIKNLEGYVRQDLITDHAYD